MSRLNYRIPLFPPTDPPETHGCGRTNVQRPVEITWEPVRRAEGYAVEVYRQDAPDTPIATFETGKDQTSLTLDDLSGDTHYTWRVRAYNRAGQGPWSPLCAFHTLIDKPGPFALLTPGDEAGCITDDPIELTWTSSAHAAQYRVLVAQDAGFTQIVKDERVSETRYALTPDKAATYYWKVTALNAGGETTSETWSFSTASDMSQPPEPQSPARGETVSVACTGDVLLSWSAVPAATNYEVAIMVGSSSWAVHRTPHTSWLLQGVEADTSYTWRVRATGCGVTDDSVPPPPPPPPPPLQAPVPISPTNRAACVPI